MTSWRIRPPAYAAGLAVVVALAGCGVGGADSVAPPATRSSGVLATVSSASPTSAATGAAADPVLARIPAAARPETMQGAEAYVSFYFEEVNRAFKAGDPSRLEGLSTSDCSICLGMAQGLEGLAREGRHYSDNLSKLNFATALDFTKTSRRVLVDAEQMQVNILDRAGKVVDHTDPAELRFVVTVSFGERWTITRLQKAKS